MDPLAGIEFWHWWVAAIGLIIVEALAPGAIFLWLGVSAGVVGAILLAAPELSWEYQLLIFAVLSVGSVIGWRAYHKRHPTKTDLPNLNRRGEQYVGRLLT
ncbi:MAG: NfeD family protein, partial [Proteobacteria bacterium]|nr:NfeD family protein [Pseudomonadota bacterium]